MPWNESEDKKPNKDPWGQKNPSSEQGPPNLDEVFKQLKNRLNALLGTKKQGSFSSDNNGNGIFKAGLILEIFALRAQSFEGRLQVELAQLEHLSTRLVRGWSHLERQRGGIGLRGGPGETQLEVDRRILRERIQHVKQRLEKVRKQRALSRRARQRKNLPVVSLVGYTNAGKSSLFQLLTHNKTLIADKLFATLDPTLRRIYIQDFGKIIIADTVGFIRDLPHQLVDAFHATLEETLEADLLLHVIDASQPMYREMMRAVQAVLKEIGAEQIPILEVYNKIDLIDAKPHIDYDQNNLPKRVWLSALSGDGIENLRNAIVALLNKNAPNASTEIKN